MSKPWRTIRARATGSRQAVSCAQVPGRARPRTRPIPHPAPAVLRPAALLLTSLFLVLALGACGPESLEAGEEANALAEGTAPDEGADESAATGGGSEERPPSEGVSGGRDVVRETLVVVEPLTVGPIAEQVVVSAKVEARRAVEVFPKLSNLPVTAVLVEEGQRVAAGDVLLRLYDTELRLAEQTARTSLAEARKTVERDTLKLEEQVQRIARAQRQAAKAEADLLRLEGLVADGLVNVQEVDDARLAAGTAEDDLELARFSHDDAELALALSELRAEQAAIDHERALTDLSHTQVRAPIDGVVATREVEVGSLSSMSTAAFRVVDVDDLMLDLRVPQDALGRLAASQTVDVRSVTHPDARFTGTVRMVNPVLDQATGTVHTLVDLAPAEGLVPGLFCEARIITASREQAVLVDKRAVLYEDDQPVVFALDEDGGTVRKLAFEAGAATPGAIEMRADLDGQPVDPSLRVVVVGQESLKDGGRVRVQEEAY